jgi:hypothetical protein
MGAGFVVFRSRSDSTSAKANVLNTGLLKNDGIAEEYTPPIVVDAPV